MVRSTASPTSMMTTGSIRVNMIITEPLSRLRFRLARKRSSFFMAITQNKPNEYVDAFCTKGFTVQAVAPASAIYSTWPEGKPDTTLLTSE